MTAVEIDALEPGGIYILEQDLENKKPQEYYYSGMMLLKVNYIGLAECHKEKLKNEKFYKIAEVKS